MNHLRLFFFGAALLLMAFIPVGLVAQTSWYEQGRAATDHNRKVECFTKSLEVEGENAYAYFYRGWAYYSLGRYEKALRDLTKAESMESNLQKQYVFVAMGWCKYSTEKFDEATDLANKAMEAKSDFSMAYYLKGSSLIMQDKAQDALNAFSKFITLEPENPKGYASRSQAYFLLENFNASIADCDKASALDPTMQDVVERKALALLRLGRSDEGISLIKEKLSYKHDDPLSLSKIGEVFYNNRDYQTAIEYHTQAMKLYDKKCQQDREYIKIYRNDIYNIYLARGSAFLGIDDKQRALADYKHCTLINENDYRAWLEIGELQTFQKNWTEGAQAYERAFAIKPTIPYGWVNLGFCYDKLLQPDKAIAAYTRGIANNPDVGLLYNNRGFGYLEMKRYDEALRDLEKAIEVEPHIVMSHVSLGQYYYARKMYPEAIKKLDEAIKMPDGTVSSYTSAYFTRGLCYFDQEDYNRAKDDFIEAIKLTNNHVLAHEKLGIAYFNLGKQCDAYKMLRKTLDLESTVSNKEAKEAPKYLGKMTTNPCTK